MIRGDYIHHGLPEKTKNTGGGAGESFHTIARRVGLLGGVWSEKWGGYLEKMALGWPKGWHPRRLTRRPLSDRSISSRKRDDLKYGGGWVRLLEFRVQKMAHFQDPSLVGLFV